MVLGFELLHTGNQKTGTLANSEDPDEMPQHAAFHQVLYCLLKLKQPSRTETHHNLENSTFDPLICRMGNPILIVAICMGNPIKGLQRVKSTNPQRSESTYVIDPSSSYSSLSTFVIFPAVNLSIPLQQFL